MSFVSNWGRSLLALVAAFAMASAPLLALAHEHEDTLGNEPRCAVCVVAGQAADVAFDTPSLSPARIITAWVATPPAVHAGRAFPTRSTGRAPPAPLPV